MPKHTVSVMLHTSTVDVAHEKSGVTLISAFTVSFWWRVRVIDEISNFPPTMVSIVSNAAARAIAEKEVLKQIKQNAEVEEKIRDFPWFIRTISTSDRSIQEKDAEGIQEVDLNEFYLKDPTFKESGS